MTTMTRQDRHRISGCGNCQMRKKRLMAGIDRNTATMRERSRLTFREPISLKSGNLFVDRIDTPPEVGPEGTIDTVTKVSNGAFILSAFDPDSCDAGQAGRGYEYELRIKPSWTGQVTRTNCIATAAIGTKDVFHQVSLTAPRSPGTHEIEFELFLPGSRRRGSVTKRIVVEEGADLRPDPETGTGDPGGDGGGECNSIGDALQNPDCSFNEALGATGGASLTLVGLVVLFVVLSTR